MVFWNDGNIVSGGYEFGISMLMFFFVVDWVWVRKLILGFVFC